jgi:hypothetical protein
MIGNAAGSTRSRLTHFGSRLGFAQCSQFVMCSLWDEGTGPFSPPWSHVNLRVVAFAKVSAFDHSAPGTYRTVVYHRQASFWGPGVGG